VANIYYSDQQQQKAAKRRKHHPHLPFDPGNPYDTPLLDGETASIRSIDTHSSYAEHIPSGSRAHPLSTVQSLSGDTEQATTQIVPSSGDTAQVTGGVSIPPVGTLQSLSCQSASLIDHTAFAVHPEEVDPLQQRLDDLKDRKRKREMLKEIETLEADLENTDKDDKRVTTTAKESSNTCIVS
jgi:hypothetical protein